MDEPSTPYDTVAPTILGYEGSNLAMVSHMQPQKRRKEKKSKRGIQLPLCSRNQNAILL
jgi:hypothetical protein